MQLGRMKSSIEPIWNNCDYSWLHAEIFIISTAMIKCFLLTPESAGNYQGKISILQYFALSQNIGLCFQISRVCLAKRLVKPWLCCFPTYQPVGNHPPIIAVMQGQCLGRLQIWQVAQTTFSCFTTHGKERENLRITSTSWLRNCPVSLGRCKIQSQDNRNSYWVQ